MPYLKGAMNLDYYIHETEFRDFEELHDGITGQELPEAMVLPMRDWFNNMGRYSELENTDQIVYKTNEIENIVGLAKKLIELEP